MRRLLASVPERWLRILLPSLRWRSRVNRTTLKLDLIAGLTGAALMLPQGVAFATIAGMPPQYGLYAGMIPAIIAALFGSSWHLVSGPTTAASVVLFSALSPHALPGSSEYIQLALTLTLMVGLFQLVMGLARMGALVNFISHTVVIGFTAGAALLIAVSQLPHLLGVAIARGGYTYETLLRIGERLPDSNGYTLAVGIVTLLSGLLSKRYWSGVPYMLTAMVAGSVFALVLDSIVGKATTAISMVGALPAMLPPLSAPEVSFSVIKTLAPAAVAMTLLALTEAVSIARSLAIHSGQKLDGNQEFIGQGLSNIVASFSSAYVTTGSFNRSAINYAAGAQTPLSAIFAAVLLMAAVVLIAPLTNYLPTSALAGLLLLVAWSLIDFQHIRKIIRTSRSETAILASTFITTLLVDLEFAILLGVGLSLFLFVMNSTRPRIHSRIPDRSLPNSKFNTIPGAQECPQLKILRLDGSLYFGSVYHIEKMLSIFRQREPRQKHLLLVSYSINQIDISGAEFLNQEATRRRSEGGGLYLYRTKEHVEAFLRRGGYLSHIGEENLFAKKGQAIATIYERLDKSICAQCKRSIFFECHSADTLPQTPTVPATAPQEQAQPASTKPAQPVPIPAPTAPRKA